MDSHQATEYSAPTSNPADLPSSNPHPVPTMSQTRPWGPPDPYRTMPVDTEDPPRTSYLLHSTNHPYGINEETGEPFEYPPLPSPPAPPALGAPSVSASVLDATPRLSSPPSRRSTRTRRPTTRQPSTPARPATNDRVYKTTDRHRNVSQQAHAQYRDKEVGAARALHGMVPGDFQSDEAIRAGGTKEKMRAMEDAMSYIAALEEENRELRRQLGG